MRRLVGLATLAIAASSMAVAAGPIGSRVVDITNRPIGGAVVCTMSMGIEARCVTAGPDGTFEIDPQGQPVRVLGDDYLPKIFDNGAIPPVVVLERTPTLLVRVRDAKTGAAIDKGNVFVVFTTGARKGPFVTNLVGVRVRRVLAPGEIRVFAEAPGYRSSASVAVVLEAGKESEIALSLTPEPAATK